MSARKSKKVEETERPPSTKEEIEAAVNACYGKCSDPMLNIPTVSGTPEEVERRFDDMEAQELKEEYAKSIKEYNGVHGIDAPSEGGTDQFDMSPTPTDDDVFANGCVSLDITAEDCKRFSLKHPDHTIDEYIIGINKKIFTEAQGGGFSTNIRFKVIPSDWTNVYHIMDWYRVRGFEVSNYECITPQIGADAGTMVHTFTISWAMAQVH